MGNSGLIAGAFSSDTTLPTPVPINKGGTGEITAQAAIDALTAVSGASTAEVLTKDGSGNAAWTAAVRPGGRNGRTRRGVRGAVCHLGLPWRQLPYFFLRCR